MATSEIYNGYAFETGPTMPIGVILDCTQQIGPSKSLITGGFTQESSTVKYPYEARSILFDHEELSFEFIPNNMVSLGQQCIFCLQSANQQLFHFLSYMDNYGEKCIHTL